LQINVVSDVHYQLEGLAAAADGADLFICLGDLVLFLDYDDPDNGIFSDLFGPANTERYIRLRSAKRFEEARAFGRELWESIGADPWQEISQRVGEQYEQLFSAMPDGLLTFGNVDVPAMWPGHAGDGHRIVDGESIVIDDIRLGFVGGGLRTPMRTPFEISDEDFQAKVDRLGPVDVLCSHIPPAVGEICYDVEARRLERGSVALRRYIEEFQPRYALHGHVHNPLVPAVTIGRTQVLNVGHFRRRMRPFELFL